MKIRQYEHSDLDAILLSWATAAATQALSRRRACGKWSWKFALPPSEPLPPVDKQKITYERGKAKNKRNDDCVTDTGLRFGPDVAVKTIALEAPQLSSPDADQYDIIAYNSSHGLAQYHSAYEVLCCQGPVLKRKGCGTLVSTPAAFNVL